MCPDVFYYFSDWSKLWVTVNNGAGRMLTNGLGKIATNSTGALGFVPSANDKRVYACTINTTGEFSECIDTGGTGLNGPAGIEMF